MSRVAQECSKRIVVFPAIIICELLGIPKADRHAFRRWTDAIVSTTTSTPGQVQETYVNMAGYLVGLFAQRGARPGDDRAGRRPGKCHGLMPVAKVPSAMLDVSGTRVVRD
jgi:hypothetical protein